MRRMVLCAVVSAVFSLALNESVSAQSYETVGLAITQASHNARVSGSALGNWTTSPLDSSQSGALESVSGSQTSQNAGHGEYSVQGSSETVAGTPGTTVTGLNLNSLAQSTISASDYGTAQSRFDNLTGSATATVQATTLQYPLLYVADATISVDEVDDNYTGTYARCTISMNGQTMADVTMSGTTIMGYTTEIDSYGQNQQVWLSGVAVGAYIPVQFVTDAGDQITLSHTVQLTSRVDSYARPGVVTSQTWVSTLEDIQVTCYE